MNSFSQVYRSFCRKYYCQKSISTFSRFKNFDSDLIFLKWGLPVNTKLQSSLLPRTRTRRCSSSLTFHINIQNQNFNSERLILKKRSDYLILNRNYSSTSSQNKSSLKPLIKEEEQKQNTEKKKEWRDYFFLRWLRFLDGYQNILEKKFPGAMNVYRVFVIGFKDFSIEVAKYVKIKSKIFLSPDGVKGLSYCDLDIYYRLKKDMLVVGPVLLISALPFANYIVFPIAYYFPKHLLSSHFWSIQQKAEFILDDQKQRQKYYRPLFRQLQQYIESIEDKRNRSDFQTAMHKLGSGSHPSANEIMRIKTLFENIPYNLQEIHGPHVRRLCKIHGIRFALFKRKELYYRAELISAMDEAILREGLDSLKIEELRKACYLRGLNASNTSSEDMTKYLRQWIAISSSIQPYAFSLLLHLPILLSYNNPNNWALKS